VAEEPGITFRVWSCLVRDAQATPNATGLFRMPLSVQIPAEMEIHRKDLDRARDIGPELGPLVKPGRLVEIETKLIFDWAVWSDGEGSSEVRILFVFDSRSVPSTSRRCVSRRA
jgi:hypothetical protein